ncbi:MAG: ThiF family adenylyltransferase [Defluviicoccus sp.]|nr:ThiF family adenylyltransferase [Defluviicoccus sp.]
MSQQERTIQLLGKLSGRSDLDLSEVLAPGRVGVVLAPEAADTPQGQLLFSFVVNLIARLYPVVQQLSIFVGNEHPLRARTPRWNGETLSAHLGNMLGAISPPVEWCLQDGSNAMISEIDEVLVVGDIQTSGSVYVGCDGWDVLVSSDGPYSVSTDSNAVSVNVAACFGVSELFKRLLVRHASLFSDVPITPLSGSLTFSALTYKVGESQFNPPFPETIDLGRLTLVGLGAGGGATAYTLASVAGLRGHVNVIEPDEIIEQNLNRYVFADAKDASNKRKKADIIAELLGSSPGISLSAFSKPWSEVIPNLQVEDFQQVSAAVHSRAARRELQYETPLVLWDAAASEDGEFRIWRHTFGQSDCMFCKHPSGEQDPERGRALQLATVLGLSAELLMEKIRKNDTFTVEECEAIQRHVDDTHEFDLPSPSQRLDDWESAQCGKLHVRTVDEDVPIPFSPVMAGVLIAGEIIKERVFPESVLDSYYFNTLLGRFMTRMVPNRRRPRAGCEHCSDADFQAQHHRRWARAVDGD